MKRSELNAILCESKTFLERMNFHLPVWAHWSPEEWGAAGEEYDEVRDNLLGWDITDFGMGRWKRIGLLLFTIRNGNARLPRYSKPYCEKILICGDEQVTPTHFHFSKMEDIICRGGGRLMLRVWNGAPDGARLDTPVAVNIDGHAFTVAAGTTIELSPGQSITLPPYQYHEFWGKPEAGESLVLVGEVSTVNDDATDNRFLDEGVGRFPAIEEDEPPLHLLCTEYPRAR
ncbi:MAG: D-lyxose/D-mannose family sugar isomerase [Armatimonadota bacterium]